MREHHSSRIYGTVRSNDTEDEKWRRDATSFPIFLFFSFSFPLADDAESRLPALSRVYLPCAFYVFIFFSFPGFFRKPSPAKWRRNCRPRVIIPAGRFTPDGILRDDFVIFGRRLRYFHPRTRSRARRLLPPLMRNVNVAKTF